MESITFGKRYSLTSSRSASEEKELATFQYVFKPSSIDNNKPGSLSISESNEVVIALPTTDGETGMEKFKGIATKPSNEFILVFDGVSFQLEKVTTSVINIRHSRNENTYSTKDVSIGDARKYHGQALLLRARPRPVKRKRVTKQAMKESSSVLENVLALVPAVSNPSTTTQDNQQP